MCTSVAEGQAGWFLPTPKDSNSPFDGGLCATEVALGVGRMDFPWEDLFISSCSDCELYHYTTEVWTRPRYLAGTVFPLDDEL